MSTARRGGRVYAIAEIEIHDPSWVEDYVRVVTPLVEAHGGRYLARTHHVEWLEGERAGQRIVLLVEWPSRAAAMAFYDSEEYAPYKAARLAGAHCELRLVAAEDVTGAARIG